MTSTSSAPVPNPPADVHPLAIDAMREVGIDISKHRSKSLEEFHGQSFDYVITVCDDARDACPTFPGAVHQLHWGFDDPAHAPGHRRRETPRLSTRAR